VAASPAFFILQFELNGDRRENLSKPPPLSESAIQFKLVSHQRLSDLGQQS
jgi:hypothetical protein